MYEADHGGSGLGQSDGIDAMNILFLTTHLNTGGITSYLLSLTRGLSQRNHNVIVASAGGNCESLLSSCGGKHFNLGFRTKSEADLRIYLNLGRLKQLIHHENIDVIHAHTRVTQVMGYFLSAQTRKPLITTCHGFFKPRFFRRIFPCWGNAVIAISQPVRKHLIQDFHVEAQKVHTIANGVDCTQFVVATEAQKQQRRQQWNIKAKIVLGIIARLSDVKGIDVLLHSLPRVIQKYPDLLLMIVGEGPEHDMLVALVDQLNLRTHVRFEKIINQTAELLPVFDVFVMPSRQEGLGLSVMEAQACALPVVASRVGGLVDLIEDAKTGFLVAPEYPLALADKIIEVLDNPAKAKQVGLTAREYMMEHFSSTQMVLATEKVYGQYTGR